MSAPTSSNGVSAEPFWLSRRSVIQSSSTSP
ncbi:Uncharacterised protein [Mycobacteroides abscessus subsp. abscessus]|nr:Uncharacterised protein [Mycobacteroides abscessus subsp. abscessus]